MFPLFLCPEKTDSVAQLVEQLTLNQRVQSSSLCGSLNIGKGFQRFC